MACSKQTMTSELFRKREKARDDSLVVVEIDPESNNIVDCEETLSGKHLAAHAAATSMACIVLFIARIVAIANKC